MRTRSDHRRPPHLILAPLAVLVVLATVFAISWIAGKRGEAWLGEIVLALGLVLSVGLATLCWWLLSGRSELRGSHERYRNVVEDMPALVCRFRPDTTLTFINRSYADYLGAPAEELVGRRLDALLPAESRPALHSTLAGLTHDQPSVTYEHEVVAPNGKRHWQEWNDRALFDEAGRLVEFQSVGVDTTETHRAAQEIRRSEQRFKMIFDSVSDGILIFDVNGVVVDSNQRVSEMFGRPGNRLVGLRIAQLGEDETGPKLDAIFRRVLAMNTREMVEWSAANDLGRRWWAELHLRRTDMGGRRRLLGVLRDTTERRRLERTLQQAQKMQAVGTLAGGIAHDFNNILTAIIGHNEIAGTCAKDELSLQLALKGIRDACDQARRVTRSLLTFSRSAAVERKPVRLGDAVTAAIGLLRPMLPDAIEIRSELPPGNGPRLRADTTQLQQVLVNLAVNARDAMPDGGVLTIALTTIPGPDGGHVAVLSVADTGIGMPDEVRRRALEPFFTTKTREQGTGLGMAVVHGIVAEHGGRLEIESRPSNGTVVTIYLPCEPDWGTGADPRTGPETTAAPPASRQDGRGHGILVVEDNEQVRGLIQRALESRGFQVSTAGDGEIGVACFEREGHDLSLVIVDLDLPKLSGTACLAQFHRTRPDLPAILISGNPGLAGEELADNVVLLPKPFALAELASVVARLIDPPGPAMPRAG